MNIAGLIPRKEIKLEDLKKRKIGIDAFNALYQFLSSIRSRDGTPLKDSQGRVTSHLQGLFTRTVNLISCGADVCYVFDGEPPKLKSVERGGRAERKVLAETKFKKAMQEEDIEAMYKYSKQFSRLTDEMVEESKKLIQALGLPVVQAPSEAEAQCAAMCKAGDIWATASQDHDALLFASPRLVRNLTLSQKRRLPSGKYVLTFIELVELKEVLRSLHLNQDQLIALGILVGTDFNPGGVKGIGPKKALAIIKNCKRREQFGRLFSKLETDFDWREIFDVIKKIPITKKYKLRWAKADKEKVKKLLVDEHDFSEERVDSVLSKLDVAEDKKKQKGLGEFL